MFYGSRPHKVGRKIRKWYNVCYGYQPVGGVGDGLVTAASSSSAIKVSLTNRPTYQKAPSPSLAGQQSHRSDMRDKTLNGIRHAARGQDDRDEKIFGLCPVRPSLYLRDETM